ncbi:MAG: prepilin-type N-terminal cleavage/methylation domain-containing protein [Phycisphaerales bacterium]|nr:prepilin-type N-terminal cleavage/methylation domain-containing protein [Phycisphaerales bacterium]
MPKRLVCSVTCSCSASAARSPAAASAAFTLVEMLISLFVIAIALTIVVTAFAVTTRTTRQAAAYAEVNNWVRQFTLQLEDDLRYIDPANSALVVVGRTQKAALNEDERQAGKVWRVLVGDPDSVQAGFDPSFAQQSDPTVTQYSDPRADILMFFTNRPSQSQAPAFRPENAPPNDQSVQEQFRNGARTAPIQVVYGHASYGDYATQQPSGQAQWTNALRHINSNDRRQTASQIPLSQWHLARRVTLFDMQSPPSPAQASNFFDFFSVGDTVSWDALTRCYPSDDRYAADVARFFSLDAFLGPAGLSTYAAVNSRPYLFDSAPRQLVENILYHPNGRNDFHVATILREPPVDLRSNLGLHLLPGCAWFQVEFLMPEDALNSPDNPNSIGSASQRWAEAKDGDFCVFVPDTDANRAVIAQQTPSGTFSNNRIDTFSLVDPDGPDNVPNTGDEDTVANRRIRMWPYAIRITVRAFDPKGRLPEPLVRTIIHRFP